MHVPSSALAAALAPLAARSASPAPSRHILRTGARPFYRDKEYHLAAAGWLYVLRQIHTLHTPNPRWYHGPPLAHNEIIPIPLPPFSPLPCTFLLLDILIIDNDSVSKPSEYE
jgi:hypothetical protein